MIFDYLFLPMLFFIGLVTSYQDFKEGKIRNKWILLGLLWGLGIYFLLLIWNLIVPYLSSELPTFLVSYLFKSLINSAISLIIGYLLWYFNLWSAGDAKLFFIFSLLLPLKYYWRSALPYFPSFALLINIFIPILFFLIFQNFFYFLKKASAFRKIRLTKIKGTIEGKIVKLKTLFKINYLSYLKVGFGFLLIFMSFQLIKFELKNHFSQLGLLQAIPLLMITLLRKSLSRVLKKNWVLILILLGIISYLTVVHFLYSQAILPQIFPLIKNSMLFMLIFIIVSALLAYTPTPKKQKKHLPFAIFLLIGVLITIILKGSLISLIFSPGSFFQ
jgi:hypothetical protein